ncbi:MAG: GTP-binding protein [Pseudanabaenaceae cyanobacterium]
MRRVILVAGTPGSGKTTFIAEQLRRQEGRSFYSTANPVPINSAWLRAEFPDLGLVEGAETWAEEAGTLWVEVGFHQKLAAVTAHWAKHQPERRAWVAAGVDPTPWQEWGATIYTVPTPLPPLTRPQAWRVPLAGQVLDPPSLHTFWQELTAGAYGTVIRAKGICELPDGQAWAVDFAWGHPDSRYRVLPWPRWLQGRPDRFSGLEVVGEHLQTEALAATLTDCLLTDAVLAQYQAIAAP